MSSVFSILCIGITSFGDCTQPQNQEASQNLTFFLFFCPLMATARNWNKSFMHIELCAGAVAIGRRGLVNQIPILIPDPGS